MEASKVYFTNMRTKVGESLLEKLKRLIRAAGIAEIPMEKQYVAIKIHFGEPGNLAFLRPNIAKAVADTVTSLGGLPFLTDCNTLYAGRRKNALEHLGAAEENGFNSVTCGCPLLIADGLRGTDETIVPLTGTTYVTEAKIGHAVMDADVVISLNHFKGHEAAGFGGAIKNLGMGCASIAGKMEQHCGGKPHVIESRCRGCRVCARFCAHNAISFGDDRRARIDRDKCVGCGRCIGACASNAIHEDDDLAVNEFVMKMAEYAKAVVQNRPSFHINIVAQVSPYCDCRSDNDLPIIPDVGMFASFDPVALDVACADACNRQPVIPGSMLDDHRKACACSHGDHFSDTSPETDWRVCMEHAERIGVGTRAYELIPVK